jgi:UDP:flavonoid glycosyltransferase YjiC (YdhE family)
VHLSKVPEGAVYNSLVAASEVIWNIHVDWPGSSNTLTKAALFEKPVLVGDGHLLAERVRKFRVGEVCQEDSTVSVTQALHAILDAPEAWVAAKQPMWGEYREQHSPERLHAAFQKILARV